MAKKKSKDTPKPRSAPAGSQKAKSKHKPALIVYRLPGGVEIVATRESGVAHGGTVVEEVATAEGAGVITGPVRLVACRLPDQSVIVTTQESCEAITGAVVV